MAYISLKKRFEGLEVFQILQKKFSDTRILPLLKCQLLALSEKTNNKQFADEFDELNSQPDSSEKFDHLMAMVHLFAEKVNHEFAFEQIQKINLSKESHSNESQLIVSKIFLLSSLKNPKMLEDIMKKIPADLDMSSSPFRCCQV